MITVHHLDNSRSHRILFLLEELGLDYRIVEYRRDPATRLAPPELQAIHPLGKSPVVELDDGEILVESGAIIETLLDRYDPDDALRPAAGTPAHLRYRRYLHYAEGSLMPLLLVGLVVGRIRSAKLPFFARPVARRIADGVRGAFVGPQLEKHLDHLDAELAAAPWFAGDSFTAADIQMSFPLQAAAIRSGFERHPNLERYLDRLEARPAWGQAVARGGALELRL